MPTPATETKLTKITPLKAQAWEYRLNHNLAPAEIARLLQVDPSTVTQYLRDLNALIPSGYCASTYSTNRIKLLEALEYRLITSLSDGAALKKASYRDRVISLGVLIDKRRLESGASTSNTSISVVSKLIHNSHASLFNTTISSDQPSVSPLPDGEKPSDPTKTT